MRFGVHGARGRWLYGRTPSIDMHDPRFLVSMILLSNSTRSCAPCAPAQVNVDFLDGEEWPRSTSFSSVGFRIFDILFVLVDVGNLLARCVARARLPSLLVPPPCLCAPPPCSPASDSRPSTDSAWQDFLCRGLQHGAFDLKDGRGRASGVAAGSGGAMAASERLLPLRAAAGAARGWPFDGQAGRAWRVAGAGGAAGQPVECAWEGR